MQLLEGKAGGMDGVSPMTYNRNPVNQSETTWAIQFLNASLIQFRDITAKPIIDILRGFQGEGGTTSPATLMAQYDWMVKINQEDPSALIYGYGIWSLEKAILPATGIWETVKSLPVGVLGLNQT